MGHETKDKEAFKGTKDPLREPLKPSSAVGIGETSDSAQIPSREEAERQTEQRRGEG